jgi:regulator of telomere elongation helicase 1
MRDSKEYLRDLGYSIINTCRIIPDGVLIFFTSYLSLSKAISEWKLVTGLGLTIYDRISKQKQIFFEQKDKLLFKNSIESYEACINAGNGAIYLAVCRGKASEGLDFSDKKARCVIICGIPFPYAQDAKVMLKKKTLDESRGMSGSEWYNQQASRAVNQAIGR